MKNSIKQIEDITNAFYINLEHRKDRKNHVEQQLESVGIKAVRFNAIKMDNGAIGCSMSHLKCLEIALSNNWSHVCICEDDITFLNPEMFKNQFNTFLKNHDKWDVILLGGNVVPPYKPIDDTCIKISQCQTTTGYLVNGNYIKILMENIKMGINKLIRNPSQHKLYAIDKHWFYLQKVGNWFLIIPLSVIQLPNYSDIEKKNTNYTEIMTDIDKKYLLR